MSEQPMLGQCIHCGEMNCNCKEPDTSHIEKKLSDLHEQMVKAKARIDSARCRTAVEEALRRVRAILANNDADCKYPRWMSCHDIYLSRSDILEIIDAELKKLEEK